MGMIRRTWLALALALLGLQAGCTGRNGGEEDAGSTTKDAGSTTGDAGSTTSDAGSPPGDAGSAEDGGTSLVDDDQDGHPAAEDCDDHAAEVWRELTVYPDTDLDGIGAGEAEKRCSGTQPPRGYSLQATDCAPEDAVRWRQLSYFFRDVDGDGFTVASSGQVCGGEQLPAGYTLVSSGSDCDDTQATRWALVTSYVDTDGDGFGTGDAVLQCTTGIPELGYAPRGQDCAPGDNTRWRMLAYSHRDEDLDGATRAESGQVCGGAALPAGYTQSPGGDDCNDTNAAVQVSWSVFPDTDGDGVGAGSRETVCAGKERPAGYSPTGTDCEPEDASHWQWLSYLHRDTDLDGFTVPSPGQVCSGTALPPGYATSARGEDCDDSNTSIHQSLQGWPDTDGDGVGAGTAKTLCTDGSLPPSWSPVGTDCAPDEADRWKRLGYTYVDQDGDGQTVRSTGSVCTGDTLPLPYFTKATGNDCDDADALLFRWSVLYPDKDSDGAGAPPRVIQCIGESLPLGHSIYGDDVNDADPSRQVDAEQDEEDELILEL
ncbi:hypothetical protein JRI60_47395 [Archangium violaceum]|uniref:hypothetical protein n=1 Tax=Archangium violaceum TaxID=83451 RepID=UPI0019528B30|nr:hypothetical protein [Archangium violaceum]QRN96548.1 hypothetical protein JRI60_47395 [Archangium violaceum]